MYIQRIFMVCIRETLTHLHHKWYVHSIRPLVPRAKQPVLHIHTRNTAYSEESVWYVVKAIWTHSTQGCGAQPVSIGSRRRRAEWT